MTAFSFGGFVISERGSVGSFGNGGESNQTEFCRFGKTNYPFFQFTVNIFLQALKTPLLQGLTALGFVTNLVISFLNQDTGSNQTIGMTA